MSPKEIYTQHIEASLVKLEQLKKQLLVTGVSRLILVLFFVYFIYLFLSKEDVWYVAVSLIFVVVFILIKRYHDALLQQKNYQQIFLSLNQAELAHLLGEKMDFEVGGEFIQAQHYYSNDVDLFGQNSLFQFLNRCKTYLGKNQLANNLAQPQLNLAALHTIQACVKELKDKVVFRWEMFTLLGMIEDEKQDFLFLDKWRKLSSKTIAGVVKGLIYLLPFLTIGLLVLSWTMDEDVYGKLFTLSFILNLIISALFIQSILKEINKSSKIENFLNSYHALNILISQQKFTNEELLNHQKFIQSFTLNKNASLNRLSKIFKRLDSVQNIVVFILYSGLTLYHLRALLSLQKWRADNHEHLKKYFTIIGDFDYLQSLANFYYNHATELSFPTLHQGAKYQLTSMLHPLMLIKGGVKNSLDFDAQKIILLTGSNMAGKSTFLRAVALNHLLANIGAPVACSVAIVPLKPLLSSMRVSDVLSEETSYFFAEVKKLKSLVEVLKDTAAIVLLDEILRGTNSEDKKAGTKAFIESLLQYDLQGIIATHDIELCAMETAYPNQIVNYCFESYVNNGELVFDYQLNKGISKNKNALFLLKQEGVI